MDYIMKSDIKVLDNIDFDKLKLIEEKIKENVSLTEQEAHDFLDYLVYITRCLISQDQESSFRNKCDLAQSMMSNYLAKLNVEDHPNSTLRSIDSMVTGHNFNCLKLSVDHKDKYYIVDPTYRQFFLKENCNEHKYILNHDQVLVAPHPGYFIAKKDYPLVENFLYCGYSEMTKEFSEVYGNSFYKTKTGILKQDTDKYQMSGSIYMKLFLKGNETLSKNEDELRAMNCYIEPFNKLETTRTRKL